MSIHTITRTECDRCGTEIPSKRNTYHLGCVEVYPDGTDAPGAIVGEHQHLCSGCSRAFIRFMNVGRAQGDPSPRERIADAILDMLGVAPVEADVDFVDAVEQLCHRARGARAARRLPGRNLRVLLCDLLEEKGIG